MHLRKGEKKFGQGPSSPSLGQNSKERQFFLMKPPLNGLIKKTSEHYYEGNDGDAKDGRVDGRSKQMRIAQRRL